MSCTKVSRRERWAYRVASLSDWDRDWLRTILADFGDRIDEIALFGSRATGTARANSDIDLVIYGRLDEADVDRLWTLFDDSPISVSVDVIAYDRELYPPLRRHIDRTRQVLFTNEQLRTRGVPTGDHDTLPAAGDAASQT